MSLLPGNAGRRHPVHQPPLDKDNRSVILLLTVCTKGRQPLLANPRCHDCLTEWWRKATHWFAGRYVILPDHIHVFCAPASDGHLEKWVAYWKNGVARQQKTGGEAFWQRDFWDTQMRTVDHYESQWEYVRHNPVRHGLSESAEAWPFQGEIHMLDWHDA